MCTCGAFHNLQSPKLHVCLSSAETTGKTKGKGSSRMSSPLKILQHRTKDLQHVPCPGPQQGSTEQQPCSAY